MKLPVKCKFCQCEMLIDVDDDYAALGDPYKLIEKSCCNHCARLRERQRRLTEVLEDLGHSVYMASGEKERTRLREKAEKILKAYVRHVSDWERLPTCMDWDLQILDQFMDSPQKISAVVGMIWRTAKSIKRQPALLK